MLLLVTLLLCFAFLNLAYRKIRNRRFNELASQLSIPKNIKYWPIIGHSLYLLKGADSLIEMTKDYQHVEPAGAFWLGPKLFIIINKAEHVELALNSSHSLNKPQYFRKFLPLNCDGIVFAELIKWRKHRKILNPLFNQKTLDGFVDIFVRNNEKLIENLKNKHQMFDIAHDLMSCNLDIFFETSLGIDSEITEEIRKQFLEYTDNALKLLMKRVVNPIYHIDWIFKRTQCGRDLENYAWMAYRVCDEIFDRKLKEFHENSETGLIVEDKRKLMFLDYLIQMHAVDGVFTKREVLDEIAIFIIAGFETCGMESAFICLMLAMHQDVQEKLHQEIMEVIGSDREITYKDLSQLVYTEMVIKETMRLFPVGANITRNIDEELDLVDITLPKNAILVINLLGIHRSEKYYKNAMKFDPERFSPENISKRHKYCYIPFLGGPRNCIGAKFAMMSLKTLVANLIRKFRFETTYDCVESIKLEQNFTTKAVHGFPVQLFPRN